ncbi:MAG TPA: hypothetical protein VFA68_04830 [Terriglobales bacterium]|nr:hypothetical protein [Terriglobales bacterium]
MKHTLILCLLGTVLCAVSVSAQVPCAIEALDFANVNSCPTSGTPWTTHNIPLMDGNKQDYGDPNHNIISLYGTYGNSEMFGNAAAHATPGINLGAYPSVQPLDQNGNPSPNGKIVFLFLGFSNCDIEVCGGNEDIWQGGDNPDPNLLVGQPCATSCPNPSTSGQTPWNQVVGDPTVQQSFLYQGLPSH